MSICVLTFLPGKSDAQTDAKPAFETLTIRSDILEEQRQMRIALPTKYHTGDKAYPLVFVLDGDVNFEFTVGITHYLANYELVPQLLVVGLDNTDRNRDFTPSKSTKYTDDFPSAGGGQTFLRFLREEAIPALETHFRIASDRILIGHSLGGLCAVNALIHAPDLFSGFVAISPSIWWNDRELFPGIETFLKGRDSLKKRIFLSRADEGSKNIEDIKRLNQAILDSGPDDCTVTLRLFPEENHVSTAVVSTSNALMWIFAEGKVP